MTPSTWFQRSCEDFWFVFWRDCAEIRESVLETLFKWDKREVITMSKENDGGCAFPHVVRGDDDSAVYGMSLRDYFAAQAMQAIIAKSPFLASPDDFTPYEKTAIGAYDYADAMLKTRGE